jgi:hypothetical protein
VVEDQFHCVVLNVTEKMAYSHLKLRYARFLFS